MRENREWNQAWYMEQRMFPWLYPMMDRVNVYAYPMNYWNLWNCPERAEDELDMRRIQELYPVMAKRIQPYVGEICDRLEYPGSMMYDEYPDKLSLYRRAREVWEEMEKSEDFGDTKVEWEDIEDLIGVLLLQEMLHRRKKNRESFGGSRY